MSQVYFLVISRYDPQGIVLAGPDLLEAYKGLLDHSERQACLKLEFTEVYLESVLSLAKCPVLSLTTIN